MADKREYRGEDGRTRVEYTEKISGGTRVITDIKEPGPFGGTTRESAVHHEGAETYHVKNDGFLGTWRPDHDKNK